MLEQAYQILFLSVLVALALAALISLIRTITGHLIADRFIGINMLTTIVVMAICVLGLLFDEAYLADVALIYVLLSFLVVMLLCKIYINLFYHKGGRK